ncbi:BRO-N domain-containing protein [Ruegeria faecimaris]|uniref:BRO-N domain-containing protein n=1 Tax=Ruegeria faecimaris TaxID=686389 RepID=UPI0024926149|nr:BRO family protein [Ruegeria faecimaris]
MRGLANFAFEGRLFRVVERDGEPWFIAADVCRALGIQNIAQAIGRLDEDERGVCSTYTPGGNQEVSTVSESGLFCLLLRSRDAVSPGTQPHRFRKWVTGEVLPAIRQSGQYSPAALRHTPVHSDTLHQALEICREIRLTWGRAAARSFWINSGLLDLHNPEASPDDMSDTALLLFLKDKCEITGSHGDFTRSRELLAALFSYIEARDLPRIGLRTASNALRAMSATYREPGTGARFWHHKRSDTGYCGVNLRQ